MTENNVQKETQLLFNTTDDYKQKREFKKVRNLNAPPVNE